VLRIPVVVVVDVIGVILKRHCVQSAFVALFTERIERLVGLCWRYLSRQIHIFIVKGLDFARLS